MKSSYKGEYGKLFQENFVIYRLRLNIPKFATQPPKPYL